MKNDIMKMIRASLSIKTLGKIAARTLKCILVALAAAVLVFFAWIAREVHLSAYEPRGFTSEYDKDVSQFFQAWTLGAENDIIESWRSTIDAAESLEEVAGFSGAQIYFDSGKISGWQFFFALKNKNSFRGMLEVSSTGHAAETYIHRHFAEKARPMKKGDALRWLSEIQRQADEIGLAVSYALVGAGKNAFYGKNGELLREYGYGE
ncbi:MAG: hypothetical protein K2F89_07260 [Treponemataceae bacterium]|nr:hypothetical protein [Treponemataceae bacterium]